MVEEYRVHGLANLVVATEAERQVADTTAGLGIRQMLLDPAYSLNKVYTVSLVFFQSCSYRQNVHVEDDVLWWETDACQ